MSVGGMPLSSRYTAVDVLGRGAAGTTWRAWDHERRRYVCIKVLHQESRDARWRFFQEQGLRVHHPHVLTPTAFHADDRLMFHVTPLVHAGAVRELVMDYHQLPLRWVVAITAQVLAGLGALHRAGIVHRDISPGNVLLEPTPEGGPHALIADFGLARVDQGPHLTDLGTVPGTEGFIAPELVEGRPPSAASDLYAVGVLAHLMATGGLPTIDPATGAPAIPEELAGSVPLARIVSQLCAARPARRPASADAAAAQVAAIPSPPVPPEVELIDQLPPLPEGWTSTGPATESASTSDRAEQPRGPSRGDVARQPRPVSASRTSRARWVLPAAVATIAGGIALTAWLVPEEPSLPPSSRPFDNTLRTSAPSGATTPVDPTTGRAGTDPPTGSSDPGDEGPGSTSPSVPPRPPARLEEVNGLRCYVAAIGRIEDHLGTPYRCERIKDDPATPVRDAAWISMADGIRTGPAGGPLRGEECDVLGRTATAPSGTRLRCAVVGERMLWSLDR